jgi:hypothetical protein
MTTWTSDELDAIGSAEELNLASVRRDGSLRRPVTMWVVRYSDDLYVRSVNGRGSCAPPATSAPRRTRRQPILFGDRCWGQVAGLAPSGQVENTFSSLLE